MQQRTEEWFNARLGKVTGSMIHLFITDEISKTKNAYKFQLLQERITKTVMPSKTTKDQLIGRLREKDAKKFYAKKYSPVTECGFIEHPLIVDSGASPDGFVDNLGLIEIKCPNPSNHLKFLEHQKIPKKYFYQMQFQLACTDREWCDFVSFNPEIKHNPLFVKRINRDNEIINILEKNVRSFLEELDHLHQEKKLSNAELLNQFI